MSSSILLSHLYIRISSQPIEPLHIDLHLVLITPARTPTLLPIPVNISASGRRQKGFSWGVSENIGIEVTLW
jgi:hypothetical protein